MVFLGEDYWQDKVFAADFCLDFVNVAFDSSPNSAKKDFVSGFDFDPKIVGNFWLEDGNCGPGIYQCDGGEKFFTFNEAKGYNRKKLPIVVWLIGKDHKMYGPSSLRGTRKT